MAKQKLQDELHIILKPIRYTAPGPLYRALIKPSNGRLLTFPHLNDLEIRLLRRMRVIAPATASDKAAFEKAEKERLAKEKAANARATKRMAAEKASAMSKQLKIKEGE